MCIAIYNESGTISRDKLNNCWDGNPDGAGLAFFDKNHKLQIVKELTSKDLFIQLYEQAREENPEAPMLVHFRIATHGGVDLDNCHPHKIDDDNVFIHNGMLSGYYPRATDVHSDTVEFKKRVLQEIEVVYNETVQHLLEEIIGGGNKLILLNKGGFAMICNEYLGEWHEGNWYSNTSYKTIAWKYQAPAGAGFRFDEDEDEGGYSWTEQDSIQSALDQGLDYYWYNNDWQMIDFEDAEDGYTPEADEVVYLPISEIEKPFKKLNELELNEYWYTDLGLDIPAEEKAEILAVKEEREALEYRSAVTPLELATVNPFGDE